MDVSFIPARIYSTNTGFAKIYRNAGPFVGSGVLWNYCMATVTDEKKMICIAFANEFGIPPVKSFLFFYEKDCTPAPGFQFDAKTSQRLGAFWGFVFKSCFGYQGQKERVQVNRFGIVTATKYLNPPAGFSIL